MRRYRIAGLLVIVVLALMVGGAGKLISSTIATPAVTLGDTLAPTPTREFATPRPIVVTAIRTAEPTVLVETSAGLNLRDKAGGAVVGSVKAGTVLRVKIAGEWALVTEGAHKGRFVAARYLRAGK